MNKPVAKDAFLANMTAAERHLARFRGAPVAHLIAGVAEPGTGATFDDLSPADNAVIAKVASGGATEIDEAAKAAMAAFPAWSALDGDKRRAILHAIADRIEARADEIALVESSDTGQAIRYMSKAALRGAENFRFFADRAPSARDGLSLPTPTHLNYTMRVPIGPVGVITPWNTPFMLSTWKIAPALAAGCTVVHKPAEWSPLTAVLLAEIMNEVITEAGLPAGVVNCVHGLGEEAGKALTEHPLIKAVGFVGDTATGSHIMAQGSATLKRVHFELGGKNPVVVFADADFERALDAALFMIYSLNGERCTSSSRALVEASIHERFTEALAATGRQDQGRASARSANRDRAVDPSAPCRESAELPGKGARRGRERALRRRPSHGRRGKLRRAHPLHGRLDRTCASRKTRSSARCSPSSRSRTRREALAIANDVRYGLTAYVWTRDVARAHRFAQKVEAGMIWVNSDNVRHLPTPFGGMKSSGIGRDGGDYSFDFYMETKNIAIALDNHKISKIGA